jgi:Ca2+-binding RTX toxin-like protein
VRISTPFPFVKFATKIVSEPIFTDSTVFTNPADVPVATGQNPSAVNLTEAPGTIGGIDQTYTLSPTTGSQVQQVVLTGSGNRLNVSTGAANINALEGGLIVESTPLMNASGRVIEDSTKNIMFGAGDNFNGSGINTSVIVQGNTLGQNVSIARAAGGQLGEIRQGDGTTTRGFAFYGSGGSGNDNLQGSGLSDFLRGGDGKDTINANGGNDLVRGGAGSDTITLGQGQDTLYYTLDQIDGSIDSLKDFTRGQDTISLDRGINFRIANGGQSIIFTSSNGQSTTLNSTNGVLFTQNDIRFLG